MHELHIVKDLFKDIIDLAVREKMSKITKVYLRLGEFTEINEEIIRFHFKNISHGI